LDDLFDQNRDQPGQAETAEDRLWERLKLNTGKKASGYQRQSGYILLQSAKQPRLPLEHTLEWVKKPFRFQVEGIEM